MIRELILAWAGGRKPDFVIGGAERPYLLRYWLIPRNRLFNIYVHCFLRSDDDRALHDHPWAFNASWIIDGGYIEHTIANGGIELRTPRQQGDWKFRWGPAPHRVELLRGEEEYEPDWTVVQRPLPCWTVFITGPVVREWGFHCPGRGWVHWKRFTAINDPGAIGKGCDA